MFNLFKMTKDEVQELVVESIVKHLKCYINITQGLGKTRIAILTILRAKKKNPNCTIAIIVPSIPLRNQWTKVLNEWGITNYTVLVINGTVIHSKPINATITILDECHLYLKGVVFNRIYHLIKSPVIVGMSGTYSQEHFEIINKLLPCAYTITQKEAIQMGWVSPYWEANLFVEMTEQDELLYNSWVEVMDSCFSLFDQDWNTLRSCTTNYGASNFITSRRFTHQNEDGRWLSDRECAMYISQKANIYMQTLQKRNKFIKEYPSKIEATAEILNKAGLKSISFGLTTEGVDKLTALVPNSESYHSAVEPILVDNSVLAKYDFKVSKKDTHTKIAKKKRLELTLRKLEDNTITIINSANALNLGLDVDGMECAVIYSRTSQHHTNGQRLSRANRFKIGRLALIVNVVLKNTKDESWLNSARYREVGIKNYYNVDKLLNDYKNEKLKYVNK